LFRTARAKFEEEFLRRVLRRYRGNVSRAARAIDMARRNVQLKVKQYGIDLTELRDEFID
jgi:two-component system nitrogen regulation response regulator NtrX